LFKKTAAFQNKTTGIANLQLERYINQIEIPSPPLPTQRRIAAVLDKAQALVANDKRTLALYDQLAKSLFLEMFGDPVRNERGWTYKDLSTFTARIVVGHVGPTSFGYAATGIPYLRTMNVRVNEVDMTDVKYITDVFHSKLKKSVLHTDDVLISRVGVNRGMAAPCPAELDGANCGNIIVVGHTSKLDSVFLSHYLNLTFAKGANFGYSVGSAQGVVNTANVKKWPVIDVPVLEQKRFAKAAQGILKSRSRVEASLRQSEALFGSLLQEAFNGELK
jgi:type I restriction enzyme S subunit